VDCYEIVPASRICNARDSGGKIEAVGEDAKRVYDVVIRQQKRNGERQRSRHVHAAARHHDVRILALEKKPRSR
jgi:hypothetical protein